MRDRCVLTLNEGLEEIESAMWRRDKFDTLWLRVPNREGRVCALWMTRRMAYCDRGHIQMSVDLLPDENGFETIDASDGFPRFFFSFREADEHVRTFLRWRLWKVRGQSSADIEGAWVTAVRV